MGAALEVQPRKPGSYSSENGVNKDHTGSRDANWVALGVGLSFCFGGFRGLGLRVSG